MSKARRNIRQRDRDRVCRWLMDEGRHVRRSRDFAEELGLRLSDTGIPLMRLMVSVFAIHPQIRATSYVWRRGENAVILNRGYDIVTRPDYLNSPMQRLHSGARQVRRRIEQMKRKANMPVIREMQEMGATDYLALPLVFSDGKVNGITFSTDEPGGFTDEEVAFFKEIIPTVAMILEIQAGRRTALTLLNTYVGQQAGERILSGEVRRGHGQHIHAVIWYGDLRGFTELSDVLPTEEVIDILNGYFERMTDAIHGHGGQVLKLIGDGIFGIFPLGDAAFRHYSCRQALQAAIQAEESMEAWNEERKARNEPELRMGLALHVGDIVFGNIGAPDRLDFTAIGPAVNLTARLEHLTGSLGVPLLMSKTFADTAGMSRPLASLGRYKLRGVSEEQEVFTLTGLEPSKHPGDEVPLITETTAELG